MKDKFDVKDKLIGSLREKITAVKNNRRLSYIAAAVVLFICVIGVGIFIYSRWERDMYGHMPIYFFNESAGMFEPEWFPMQEGDTVFLAQLAVAQLINGTRNSRLTNVWPDESEGRAVPSWLFLDEDMLVAAFDSEFYAEMQPLEEALFRSAFTLTMVGLPGIESVKFRVGEGVYLTEWVESAETIANNPSISPMRISSVTFTLYFADETGETLVPEVYVASGVDLRRREVFLLTRLIAGPSDSDFSPAVVIPPETRVRSVTLMQDAGGYYVDLSSEFLNNFTGTPAQARMMIASIVNTLIENSGLRTRRVSFLIDSERREDFHGVSDFHLWFSFDETLVMGYGEEDYEEQEYEGVE